MDLFDGSMSRIAQRNYCYLVQSLVTDDMTDDEKLVLCESRHEDLKSAAIGAANCGIDFYDLSAAKRSDRS